MFWSTPWLARRVPLRGVPSSLTSSRRRLVLSNRGRYRSSCARLSVRVTGLGSDLPDPGRVGAVELAGVAVASAPGTHLPELKEIGFTASRCLLDVQRISHDPAEGAALAALTHPAIRMPYRIQPAVQRRVPGHHGAHQVLALPMARRGHLRQPPGPSQSHPVKLSAQLLCQLPLSRTAEFPAATVASLFAPTPTG